MLDRIGEERARATSIVQYQPNSKFPEHTHIGGEEFLVLEGTFKDQFGEFPAGTYVRNPIDSRHAPWVDQDGCTIMVKLLQMADTGEGITPLHIDLEEAKNERGVAKSYGNAVDLYKNTKTGEYVEACWLEPNQELPQGKGGEEIFILNGSVLYEGTEYVKWGWLRFPPDEPRQSLRAGTSGAQIYRKTGHLTEHALSMEKIQIAE